MKIILGITGASGAVLAKNAINTLINEHELYVVASENGCRTFKKECDIELYDFLRRKSGVVRFANDNLFAPIANSNFDADCMIILPCSTAAIGRISTGSGSTLLTRTADVMLKEGKRIVICINEAPLYPITLHNLQTLASCGVIINPLVPTAYESHACEKLIYDSILERVFRSANIKNK